MTCCALRATDYLERGGQEAGKLEGFKAGFGFLVFKRTSFQAGLDMQQAIRSSLFFPWTLDPLNPRPLICDSWATSDGLDWIFVLI